MNKYRFFLYIILILLTVICVYLIYNIYENNRIYKLKNTFRDISGQIWINNPNNFTFPELSQYDDKLTRQYSPEGVSLAFQAGGRRSYTGFIGFIRALYKIRVNGANAFESAQFVSTVSGSSWLLGTYLFANKNIDSELLLGHYIPPQEINMDSLKTINFNNMNSKYYLGSRLVGTDIKKYIQEGYNMGIEPEYLWNYGVDRVFLEPYGLNNKIVAINDKYADYIYNMTGIKPITPNEKLPFWIANCGLLNVKNGKIRGTTIFQVTSMYSGIPNVICDKEQEFGFNDINKNDCVGGFFQSTHTIGAINPKIKYNYEGDMINYKIPLYQSMLFNLGSIMGTSGSSQASKFSYIAKNVIPSFNLWTPKSEDTLFVPIGDGAHCDWTGITSLLSRNVKHIISILSCGNDIKETATPESYGDFCGLNILNLFGLNNDNICEKQMPYLYESNANQVFQKEDWSIFAQKLLDTKSMGGPVFSRNKLYVLPNYSLGIKGGYYVDLLVIVVQSSSIYNSLLPKNITDTFSNPSGPFPNFPNYPMTDSNFEFLISLEKHQINLLDSYVEWCVLYPTLKNTIIDMYNQHNIYNH